MGSLSLPLSKSREDLAPGLAASGWMMSVAQGTSGPWSSASTGSGGTTTATTRKTWVSSAQVSPVNAAHEDWQGEVKEEGVGGEPGNKNGSKVPCNCPQHMLTSRECITDTLWWGIQ